MGICLHSLDSEPKPECMINTSFTSFLQMMRSLQLTVRRTFGGFWTTFQTLVDTLDLPSVWQKYRSWGKTLRRYHHSSFTTTNSFMSTKVVHEFVFLGSTITDNHSIDSELNKQIGEVTRTLSRLTKMCMVQQWADRTYQSQCI